MKWYGRAVLKTAPTAEPVSTAEAKTHLRVDSSDDDTYIDTLVKAARYVCEAMTNRQLITATYELYLDGFPSDNAWIYLPHPPLQSVTSIAYTDSAGDAQTLSSSTGYQTDTKGIIGHVEPARFTIWPATYADTLNTVTITYKAGYGDASTNVPQSAIHGIKLLVGNWYENRESVVLGQMPATLPMAVEACFNSIKVPEAW